MNGGRIVALRTIVVSQTDDHANLVRAIEVVRRAGYTVIEAPPLSPTDVDAMWREAEHYALSQRPGGLPR